MAGASLTVAIAGNSWTLDGLGWYATGGGLTLLREVLEANGRPASGAVYDIRCGLSLKAIHEGQAGSCTAFAPTQWPTWPATADVVTVQPWSGTGSTLSTDVAAIQAIVGTQPATAGVVLFCGAPIQTELASLMGPSPPALSPPEDPETVRSGPYFDALWGALGAYGSRLALAPVAHVLYEIAQQADGAGFPGLASSADLWRDISHLTVIGCAVITLTLATVILGRPLTCAGVNIGVVPAVSDAILEVVNAICLADARTRIG